MNCINARGALDAFLDRELSPDDDQRVASHLEACPTCAATLADLRRMKQKLRVAVANQPVSLGLETRVRAHIRDQRSGFFAGPVPKFALGAAAVLVLTVGAWVSVLKPMQNRVMAVLGIGHSDHMHCTVERKNPPTGALNRPIDPEYGDLLAKVQSGMPADFQLLESHFCRWQGRRFQHIVFGQGEKKLSVIVTPKKDGEGFPSTAVLSKFRAEGIPVYEATFGLIQTAAIESEKNLAFVVSDLSAQQNERVMASLAPAIRGNM